MTAPTASPGDVLQDHVAPQSLEAEMALLGAMIFDGAVIGEIVEVVRPEMFYRGSHRAIFEALQDLYLTQRATDPVIVLDELRKRGRLEEAGGADYIAELIAMVPTAANAAHYAQIVRDKALLRNLIGTCRNIIAEATQVHEDTDQILDRAQADIFGVVAKRGGGKVESIRDVLHETIQKIGSFRDRKDRCLGIPTSYYQMDEMTSGLQASQLYIVAARPSVGKTSLAMCIAERVAVEQGKGVLLFSLEMSAEMISQQMLCSRARVNAHNLRRGILKEEDYQRIVVTAGRLAEAPFFIDDSSDLGILELRSRARRLKAEHDIQLVIVDYLQFVHARVGRNDSREREVAFVSSQLKALAKELEIPVLVLAQLNRNPEGRDDKKPRLADLRESGAIEQDADVVLLLSRDVVGDATSSRSGVCDVVVAKNRTGPTGEFQLAFISDYTRFENLSVAPAPPG